MNDVLIDLFRSKYTPNTEPFVLGAAPGRVEILGNHTDYNDGLVLTAGIQQKTYFLGQKNDGDAINIYAADLEEQINIPLAGGFTCEVGHWSSYFHGVLEVVKQRGLKIPFGFSGIFKSEVPMAAGCSSSAALELSFLQFLNELFQWEISLSDQAKLAQSAENNYAGVACGLMDQWSSAFAKENKLLMFDVRNETSDYYDLPQQPELSVLICNTQIKHTLVNSAYNERRKQCQEALKAFQKKFPQRQATHLRDLTVSDLTVLEPLVPEVIFRKAKHVINENHRILTLKNKNEGLEQLRDFIFQSHESSQNDFENSCDELDFIVDYFRKENVCWGAKLSGGGFGGCVVAMIEKQALKTVCHQLEEAYQKAFPTGQKLLCIETSPRCGAYCARINP